MVSRRDSSLVGSVATASSPFLVGSSSLYNDSASLSSTTTTHFFNVLSANAGAELSTVQHYNDIARPKNTNMESKNLNPEATATLLVLCTDGSKNRWGSFRERSSSFMESTRSKITNKSLTSDNFSNRITTSNDKVNCDDENKLKNQSNDKDSDQTEKPLNISGRILHRDQTVIHIENPQRNDDVKSPTRPFTNRGTSLKERFLGTRGRLTIKEKVRGTQVSRTHSLLPVSLKKNRLFSFSNKSIDPPNVHFQGQDNTTKVPKLHIWLSTDQAPRELTPDLDTHVLNNTREPMPRILIDQPRVIYRSVSEGTRWRSAADPSVPASIGDNQANQHRKNETQATNDTNAGDCPKSPMGKQPTWPLSSTHLLSPRPKLIHQDRLSAQSNKRADFGRQDAVMEEPAGAVDQNNVKTGGSCIESQSSWSSVDNTVSSPSVAMNSLSAPSPHPRLLRPTNSLGIGKLWGRKGMEPPTSVSDDKSEASEYSWRSDSLLSDLDDDPATHSVFTLGETQCAATSSWSSSSRSLHRQDTSVSSGDPLLQPDHQPVQQSKSLQVFRHTRSNSTVERESGQTRLTVPGEPKSRRPSLLSLRSLTRSPIPYVSMDYDHDYDYEYGLDGSHHHYESSPYYHRNSTFSSGPMAGLIPEAAPKLTLTQRLAFPNLVQNSLDRPRPPDPYSEANNGMNTAAKLITVLVLTMVLVLIIVGIYKIVH